MDDPIVIMSGLMAVLLLVGLSLTAWLVNSFRKGRGKKKQASVVDERVEQAAAPLPGAPAELVAAPPLVVKRPEPNHTLASPAESVAVQRAELNHTPILASPAHKPALEPGDVLLMRVLRDHEGFMVVKVGGRRYRRLFDIRDGEIGQQVLNTINHLVAFSQGHESRVPLPSSRFLQDVSPSPAPITTPFLAGEDVEEQSQALFDQLQQQSQPQKTSRITMDPVPFRRRSESDAGAISLNLAGEINRLLQIRVKASPEFSQRLIQVSNAPDGGLRFRVDGARYDGIDQIPDPQIQSLIRAAIAEWEAKR